MMPYSPSEATMAVELRVRLKPYNIDFDSHRSATANLSYQRNDVYS